MPRKPAILGRRKAEDARLRLIPGYDPFNTAGDSVFDPESADWATGFFRECLTFSAAEWMGQPFVLRPWQDSIVANLFGWLRPDGRRRYREAFVLVPRKNGKTEIVAGLGLLLAFADHEPAALVYCAAADREQANHVFRAARTMVQADDMLSRAAKIYTHAITVPETGSALKVVSAEAYSKHGLNAHGIIVDELHAQPNRDLVDVLTTSTGARRQPLIIYITTADFDRESICNEKYDYACKVRDGVIDDPAFLPVIFEAGLDDDWTDPAVWARVNPNLGVSVKLEYLERECRKAQETPTYENTFKRLHLNIKTQQDIRWLTLEAWDACDGTPLKDEDFRGRACYAGLDLSATKDLSACSFLFPDGKGRYSVLVKFWAPAVGAAKRERTDRVPYETWGRQGLIELTPGKTVDYDRIRARLNEYRKVFKILEIAFDPWHATQLAKQLEQDGFQMVEFGQTPKNMSAPTDELERLVIDAKLRHGGNPVMRWMVSHVAAEEDASGSKRPSKAKSTDRIDGVVATIMALGRAMLVPLPKPSVYETRGLLSV